MTTEPVVAAPPRTSRAANVARILAGLALLAALVAIAQRMPPMSCANVQSLGQQRFAVPLALAIYATAILIAVPRWMVIASAGLTFGALPGMAVAHTGAWAGACLAFILARSIARVPIERWLSRQKWYGRIAPALADDRRAGSIFVWMRINPILHYTGVSYAAGLAPIRLWPYAWGTAVGMIPMTLVVGWAGDVVGCALLDDRPIDTAIKLGIAASVVAMTIVSLIPVGLVWWRKRRAG